MCEYSAKLPRRSRYLSVYAGVRDAPTSLQLRANPRKSVTSVTTGNAHGVEIVIHFRGTGWSGLMIVENRRYQWYVSAEAPNRRTVESFLDSFHVLN
jgi:hypothetical protein